MANTQVFTLGLGVTVINPLGQAIDLLRRDVERLRRQAGGTRLRRLIGEVIRLGLELGKVRQVERQLALDQQQQHDDQIARLGDEIEAVERLRQHYLMLDRVIAGLARLKPLPGQMTVNVFQQWHAVLQGQVAPAAGKVKAPAQEPKPDAGGASLTLGKGLAITAGGLGALGLGTAYVRAYRKQSPEKQRAIRERGLTEWRENRAQALAKVAKAVITGEDGEEMARGTGAALGDLGGRALGAMGAMLFRGKGKALGKAIGTGKSAAAVKPRRTRKSQRKANAKEQREAAKQQAVQEAEEKKQDEAAQKRWAEAGGLIGEAVGDRAGGGLFNLLTEDEDPAASGSEASSLTEGQSESQVALAFSLSSAGKQLSSVGKFFKRVPVAAVLDTSSQVLDTYQSDATPAEKLEGYGQTVGGLGGTLAGSSAGWLGGAAAGAMIGSVVPGIGTVIGAAVGGALGSLGGGIFGGMAGEFAGGWLGKTVASVTGNDAPGARPDAVNSPAQAAPTQESAGSPATSTQQSPATVSPTINQQFTFTANMPVTFNNSLDDPTTLQQLEAIARRMLEDLMRQARSVQMADQPQP
ncbi:hypothetical protein [Pseudomonas putida]|uniref:Tail tape measure protein n=1 Tax=Pseudomonas putida TaxID=303 RepID=A0A6I6Y4S2_PSEPU|nr:hypothetical protein [Pseudomonas putida]QHG66584.1 hypothetical protein C2H86_20195 [Pseudomonas putida]